MAASKGFGLIALAFCASGCGSDGASAPRGFDDNGSGATSFGGSTGSNPGSGGSAPLPPEQELESSYRAPVVTGRYVWSANPESGRVAVIDPETLVVRLAEAGFQPSELAALPGTDADRAIVINSGSEDATLLRADDGGVTAELALPLHSGANAWAISPSGSWAIAWTDVARVETPDPALGFQDVTVVDLSSGSERSFELSVGYRPSRIVFDDDETTAFVVTEPGLSTIALDGEPRVTALVELTADPIDNPASRDVSITPDGALALVRVEGSSELGVVDLASGALSTVDLGAPITDLDLSADGQRAYAVAGSELLVLPVPLGDLAALPRAPFAGEVLRSVSPAETGEFAVLYSNAFASSHVGAVLASSDWSSVETRVVDVKATVTAALTAPDGKHAIVLGTTPGGSLKFGAFALVPAQMDRTVKVVGTDAAPTLLSFAPDGDHAVLAMRDDARDVHGAYLIELGDLAETFVPLASPPLSVGIVPGKARAFVAQLHPEGRITFMNLANGDAHTLTGFELAAKVTGQ